MMRNITQHHELGRFPISTGSDINLLHGYQSIGDMNDLHSFLGTREVLPASPGGDGSFLSVEKFRTERIAVLFDEVGE